jgi:PAS domain S-box-containing protein
LPVLAVLILMLRLVETPASYPAPRLQFALVLVVLFGACCVVAMVAARAFLAAGSVKLLLLGCGAIALGLSGVMATIGGAAAPNVTVTVHNLLVWIAAWLHFVGALVGPQRTVNPRMPYLVAGLTLVGAVAVLVAVAAKAGWTPTFFVQGGGGTPLRQFVLGSAIVMFVTAAVVMLERSKSTGASPGRMKRSSESLDTIRLSAFRRWYAYGLLLLSLGLAGVWMQRMTNSLLGWTGIATQLLGACWLVAAAVTVSSSRGPDRLAMLSAGAPRSIALRYVLAALFVGSAAALRLLVGGRTGTVPYEALLPAVLLAALYGGAGPALFAVLLSLVVGEALWLDRSSRFAWGDAAGWVPRAWFGVGAALLVGVALAFQRARERVQAQQSDARWRALFDSLDHGVCVCELICNHQKQPIDYRFLEVNPAFGPMTGLHDAEGRTALELVPTLERRWIDAYARVALKGETLHFEDESVPMGRRFEVFASPIEPRPLFVIRFADVTERRRSEARLAAAAARDAYGVKLAAALRPLADPLAVQETAARLLGEALRAQRVAYFEIRGQDYVVERDWIDGLPSIVGRHPVALFGDRLRAAYTAARTVHRADVAADDTLEPQHRVAYTAMGIAAHVGVPLVKAGELVAGLVVHSATPRVFSADEIALVEDTAEATWASAARARSEAALREADRRKDEFIATLAHELRNPLAPVRHAAHVLALGLKGRPGAIAGDADRVAWAADVIERQVRQMSRLIDDLLDSSRISRGLIELDLERIEFEAVVQDAVETSRPLIDEYGHTLEVSLPDEPVVLHADRLRLAQVLANMLNNAAKYSHRGGRIQLEAMRQASSDHTDEHAIAGASLIVVVRDHGIGIEPEMLEPVFETFAQGSQSTSHSRGGLGIGLSLVRRLVELHGGRVWASSRGLGKGSEFRMRLPLAAEPASPSRHQPYAPTLPQGVHLTSPPPTTAPMPIPVASGRRVLVVDDNRDGANTLVEFLNMMGHETLTAHDGQQAVDMAAKFRPDVILLDIGLPELPGYDACRRIRQQPWGRHIVIVALTGWGQAEDRRKSREAGFDAHLVKPVDTAVLSELLAMRRANDA